ncbi:MAG: hypothetical protein N4A54_06660 [Peptostreptococcaceae bacterium]|jgi:exonuclease SbcC|nr:hypothetical protein [Peptostreptococcaceae bacterium]
MPYVIRDLRVQNFKCFDSKKFYKFNFYVDKNPTILSGPNGFGKTTFFDAIELIFTKKITRLQTTIERGNANLKKNILINEADKNGVLVLTLVDENDSYLSLVAIINHRVKRLNFEESIKYSIVDGILDSDDEIRTFLSSPVEWKSSIKHFERLRFSPEHFNVYYYVSQAESVHFLKNSIAERKDSMNILLNTKNVDNDSNYIEKKIIGKKSSKTGVIVNDEITSIKNLINLKINNLKLKIKGNNLELQKVKYDQLLSYTAEIKLVDWDKENCSKDGKMIVDIDKAITEIEALHYYAINANDYKKYLHNQRINGFINNKIIMDDITEYHPFIERDAVDKVKIKNLIEQWNRTVNIYNHAGFFRKQLDADSYKKEDLSKLKEISDDLITVDIEEITELITSINKTNQTLSSKQKILNDLVDTRLNLNQTKKRYDGKSSNCPYCNHPYDSIEELELAYNRLTEILSREKSKESQKKQSLLKQLSSKIKKDFDAISLILKDIDDKRIKDLNTLSVKYEKFVEDEKRLKAVEEVYSYLSKTDTWIKLEREEKKAEVQRILQENIKGYANLEFDNNMQKYNFESIHNKFKDIFAIEQTKIADNEYVVEKISYLKYQKSLLNNNEISSMRADIKKDMIKLKKIESARSKIEELNNIYQGSIDGYKNQILKKLRVPLLIYTGKILQDYQNGLGVFISKDEMRFVSNGDAKHDILNTFSSGQLSGFVLAFLFSMNKQYIRKSEDDIGFLLVDDPVQTMDDINIASLIEVLRNDFSNKQIIISTHENDKENYILYKFLKYNSTGKSFNVKEKLYI